MASAGVLAATLAACGGNTADEGGDGAGASGEPWILGTTETVTSLDPAGSYDFGSWNLQFQMFEQLMVVPPGETNPVGDAAESCEYDDPSTLTCKLREGLKFANGHDLTSSDVAFSFRRGINIGDPEGAAIYLFTSIMDPKTDRLAEGAIETPDDLTVVFHLNEPNVTFEKLLTGAFASILDEEVFPEDKLMPDAAVTSSDSGSGPYDLEQYKPGEQAVFSASDSYEGERTPKAPQVFVQYFSDTPPLKQAIESGDVDIAWRTLSPTDYEDLKTVDGVNVIEGTGAEFRYWVWQLKNDVAKDVAVRQAAAQLIDRETIAQDAYDGTVTPTFSIVPPAYAGHEESFKEKYGEQPDVEAATELLDGAGIETPVPITMGYTPTHYGPNAVDEANEFAAQLEDSELFDVEIKSTEWEQYQILEKEGAYDLFLYGWYPDILDADNYLSPFLVDGGFFANNYSNPEADQLIAEEQASTDPAERAEIFGEVQGTVAEDVPLIPSWLADNVAVARDGMEGVDTTLDPAYIFRFWEISKTG